MNKKAVMTEVVVRSVIAVIALVTVAVILTQCYNKVAYSDAEKRFETLVEMINTLQDGEKKQVAVSLDNKGALLGFTKNSDTIDYVTLAGLSRTQIKRPTHCSKDSACVCLCDQFERGDGRLAQASCTGALLCKKISYDLPSAYDDKHFFREALTPTSYTITNGFIIVRNVVGGFPSPKTRLFTFSLTRKGDKLAICESSVCPKTS